MTRYKWNSSRTQHHFRLYKAICRGLTGMTQGNTGSSAVQLKARQDTRQQHSSDSSCLAAPLLPIHRHRAAATTSPCSKGMQWGREQSHTTEYVISTSTGRGKFYFPVKRKHETSHSLSKILILCISLYGKMCEALLQVKNHLILLHSKEKETGHADFRS